MSISLIWLPLAVAMVGLFIHYVNSESGPGWTRMTHARIRAWHTGQTTESVLWALQARDEKDAERARQREAVAMAPVSVKEDEPNELPKQSAQDVAKTLDFDPSVFTEIFTPPTKSAPQIQK